MVGHTFVEKAEARVLFIESNGHTVEDMRDVVDQAANAGFIMDKAKNLAGGLEKLIKGNVDLVVLDISSCGQEALASFRQVKEQAQSVPVLVIGNGDEELANAVAFDQEAHDYLHTGMLDARLLIQSMRHVIRLNRAQQALQEATARLDAVTSKLEALANTDALTEVLSRIGMERALSAEFDRAQRQGGNLVAVLLDCDDFKRINEALGHAVGDVVLKEISGRLKETLRPTDHIARLGSDEFLFLLPDTRLAEGMLVAEKARLAVAENPLTLTSETIRVTASLGVFALPYEVCSMEEVLSLCRLAVRESKLLGKNRVSSGEKHKTASTKEQEAIAELTETLRKGDCFRAVSMPIFTLADQKIVGYELLSRGPVGAFEMPEDLFRISCEYNLLTIVDLRCFKTCLVASALPKFLPNTRFHVNLFPSTIIDTPIERLMTLFPEDIEKGRYCIEISEQQFIGDPAYLCEHIAALKQRGIAVAIDDVGFGRSSLEGLILLEPDIVKIDRKYVTGIAKDPAKARLLKRLVNVVHALGAELIAEGIEQVEELETLLEVGVTQGQGWYWGKPA